MRVVKIGDNRGSPSKTIKWSDLKEPGSDGNVIQLPDNPQKNLVFDRRPIYYDRNGWTFDIKVDEHSVIFTRTNKDEGWEYRDIYFRLYFRNEEDVPPFDNSVVPYLYEGRDGEMPPIDAIHVKVKDNVTVIQTEAFSDCKKLVSVDMADSLVREIEMYAFFGCEALKIVRFPKNNTLKTIGDDAFDDCKSIEVLLIPPSVKLILDNAFNGCSNLKVIKLPDDFNLNKVGNNIIEGCTALDAAFRANKSKYKERLKWLKHRYDAHDLHSKIFQYADATFKQTQDADDNPKSQGIEEKLNKTTLRAMSPVTIDPFKQFIEDNPNSTTDVDDLGMTALHVNKTTLRATSPVTIDQFKQIIEDNPNSTTDVDDLGMTALHVMSLVASTILNPVDGKESTRTDVSELMKIIYNANESAATTKDNSGNIPLHYAIENASASTDMDIIRLLASAHNAITITNNSGKTAIDLARDNVLVSRDIQQLLCSSPRIPFTFKVWFIFFLCLGCALLYVCYDPHKGRQLDTLLLATYDTGKGYYGSEFDEFVSNSNNYQSSKNNGLERVEFKNLIWKIMRDVGYEDELDAEFDTLDSDYMQRRDFIDFCMRFIGVGKTFNFFSSGKIDVLAQGHTDDRGAECNMQMTFGSIYLADDRTDPTTLTNHRRIMDRSDLTGMNFMIFDSATADESLITYLDLNGDMRKVSNEHPKVALGKKYALVSDEVLPDGGKLTIEVMPVTKEGLAGTNEGLRFVSPDSGDFKYNIILEWPEGNTKDDNVEGKFVYVDIYYNTTDKGIGECKLLNDTYCVESCGTETELYFPNQFYTVNEKSGSMELNRMDEGYPRLSTLEANGLQVVTLQFHKSTKVFYDPTSKEEPGYKRVHAIPKTNCDNENTCKDTDVLHDPVLGEEEEDYVDYQDVRYERLDKIGEHIEIWAGKDIVKELFNGISEGRFRATYSDLANANDFTVRTISDVSHKAGSLTILTSSSETKSKHCGFWKRNRSSSNNWFYHAQPNGKKAAKDLRDLNNWGMQYIDAFFILHHGEKESESEERKEATNEMIKFKKEQEDRDIASVFHDGSHVELKPDIAAEYKRICVIREKRNKRKIGLGIDGFEGLIGLDILEEYFKIKISELRGNFTILEEKISTEGGRKLFSNVEGKKGSFVFKKDYEKASEIEIDVVPFLKAGDKKTDVDSIFYFAQPAKEDKKAKKELGNLAGIWCTKYIESFFTVHTTFNTKADGWENERKRLDEFYDKLKENKCR